MMASLQNINNVLIFIIGFIVGVFTASLIFIPPLVSSLLIILGFAILIAERLHKGEVVKEVLILALLIISLGIGAMRYEIKNFHTSLEPSNTGVVITEPELRESSTRFVMRGDNGEKVLVNTDLYSKVAYGDRVEVNGELEEPGIIDDGIKRPFDYGAYLAKDDIYYAMYFAEVRTLSSHNGNKLKEVLIKVKNGYVNKLGQVFQEPESGLLSAFTISGKNALLQETLEEFRKAGVIHIVVLSGLHITLITFFLFWIFSLIFMQAGTLGPTLARSATLLGLGTFVLMAGASASILRASTMAFIAIGGKFVHRQYDSTRALLVAALLMLLINPKLLVFDASFQLSFLATLGIIHLTPIIDGYLARFIPNILGLRTILSITISAQIAVSPLILYLMGNVSLVALLANVLILPVVPLAMVGGFIAIMLAYVSPVIAWPLAYLVHLLLAWILGVAHFLANLPFAVLNIPTFPFWATSLLYLAIITFLWRWHSSLRKIPSLS